MGSMGKKPIVRVGVQCILRKGDEILLVQRNRSFGEGTWCLPGGHLEPGETIVQCATRELHEETGITGHTTRIIAITDPSVHANHHMQIGVEVTSWSGKPRIVDADECRAVRFFAENSLPREIFVASVDVLAKARQGVLY
jgi:8-oxo-dGTP diphosphatase